MPDVRKETDRLGVVEVLPTTPGCSRHGVRSSELPDAPWSELSGWPD